ncbi:hypothetical protein FQN60_012772 [Etheostoma spectabile]|uniref:Uncharacterized protein n=1 Tax=Etheostoma spectabile TaxID=54343 RepID=A0A5J5D5Q6_9PERO|nr:hypothetical protein FQN60_012772 [Etheostoma spectabile]
MFEVMCVTAAAHSRAAQLPATPIRTMQWRRRHCCPIKMTWTVKRSLFGPMWPASSRWLCSHPLLVFSHQDWLPGRSGPRENPLATPSGASAAQKEKQPEQLPEEPWRENGYVAPKPLLNLSSQQGMGQGGGSRRGRGARMGVMGSGTP